MKKELIKKKKKILKRITVSEYRELLAFVEDVYLSDYSFKILLARKCSNLFFSLFDLMQEEDGGRVRRLYEQKFSGKEKPVIISDRALSYYEQKIRNGEFKSILIADDVIIHGRTIFQLYDRLQGLIGEHSVIIDVKSYAANKNKLMDKPCIQNADVKKKVDLHSWRAIVDMVIDVLYLAGQPYTSYIPNIVIHSGSTLGNAIKEFVQNNEICPLHNALHSNLNLYSYAWIDPQSWEFALFQSIRIYMNEDLEQYVVAPMVSILPIHEHSLCEYREVLKDYILPDYYEKMIHFSDELNYRAIVYVISSLWSRYFFLNYLRCENTDEVCESPLEEIVNFGSNVLNHDKIKALSVRDVIHVAEQLESLYQVVDAKTLMSLSEDFVTLDKKINMLVGNSKEDANTSIQHFLCINGDLDEEAWKKYINGGSAEPLRLSGYPYAMLTKRLAEKEENNSSVYSKSLKAIDFGKGSIVVKKFKTQKGCYFVSLLHAGEQNYKYREEKYFPYLYGLFEIERMSGATRTKDASACKQKFKEEFKKQFDWKEAGYEEEELEKLCGSDITTAYKSILLKDTWSYPKQDWLDFSISLADNIMDNGDCVN